MLACSCLYRINEDICAFLVAEMEDDLEMMPRYGDIIRAYDSGFPLAASGPGSSRHLAPPTADKQIPVYPFYARCDFE